MRASRYAHSVSHGTTCTPMRTQASFPPYTSYLSIFSLAPQSISSFSSACKA